MKLIFTFALAYLLTSSVPAQAFEDPTGGKPFLPWAWDDQFKPTIQHSVDTTGLLILGGGAASTAASHQYDIDVEQHIANGHLIMDHDVSSALATAGGGVLSVAVPAALFFIDQKNGLKVARAVIMTATTHVMIAFIAERPRPNGRSDYLPFASSFPSGHASAAFALAGSLGYAYGWAVGVPASAFAIAVSAGRISENAHWLSDVVAGATLGLFWAHASNNADKVIETAWQVAPVPVDGGLVISTSRRF